MVSSINSNLPTPCHVIQPQAIIFPLPGLSVTLMQTLCSILHQIKQLYPKKIVILKDNILQNSVVSSYDFLLKIVSYKLYFR